MSNIYEYRRLKDGVVIRPDDPVHSHCTSCLEDPGNEIVLEDFMVDKLLNTLEAIKDESRGK
jgi:hypothetical protein